MIDIDILPDKLFLEIFEKVNLFKISISHLLSDNSPAMDKLLVCFRPVLFHIFARTASECQQKTCSLELDSALQIF